jgi:hypothetical protein
VAQPIEEVRSRRPAEFGAAWGVSAGGFTSCWPAPGRTHTGTHALLLIHDLHIRVIDAGAGELLREPSSTSPRDNRPSSRPARR